jgi:hypothetical protein
MVVIVVVVVVVEQHKAFGPDLMESWNPVTRDLAVSTLKKQNLNVYSFFPRP